MDKPVALLRLVSAIVLTLPLLAQAAGLGRLTVQSFLGQPLRAEIEIVSLQPGEEDSLQARLASGNAFAQAGIEFNPALSTITFALDKRDGRPIIRVGTRQAVNEPFIDLLVELRWATGLFVREYTVLLDPPGYEGPKAQPMAAEPAMAAAPAAAPTPSPPAAPVAAPPAPAAEPAPASRAQEAPMTSVPTTEPKPEPETPAAEQAKPAAETPAQAATYEVKKGDTLGEIALQFRPEGVSFNQMLIALQRANEDAFINGNINLVRAGRILSIPDADTAAAVDREDATRLVIAQHADFSEYRSRLGTAVAAAPTAPQAAEQSAAGQITARPEAPKPAAAKDQLKLSRADTTAPGAPAAKAAGEDDLAAREKALKEAESRVADLEKIVADLRKQLEIRNQQLAQLEKQAKQEAAKPAPAPVAPKPAAQAPKPDAQAPKPAAEAPKPAAAAPKPRPLTPPPPPAPEPSLVDELLGDPIALGGLGLVVVLLAGYAVWARQRKKKSISKFQDSVLGPISGQEAAAAAKTPPPATPSASPASASQSAAGSIATDDVDPIAEADVYMAYGRDAQAEEILKEALQKDPNRTAVLAKLLEIYAGRRDAQSFEQMALKLKGVTNGSGPDWEKAMALGRSVDPGNGLYGGPPAGAAPAVVAAAVPVAAAAPAVDFDIGGGAGGGASAAAEAAPALDLDLGGAQSAAEEKTDFSPSGTLIIDSEEGKSAAGGLDFDLGGGGDKPADTTAGLNFELPATPAAEPAAAPAPAAGGGGLDFDLNLGGGDAKPADADTTSPEVDLSTISLDLGTAGEPTVNGANGDPKWQEVATKLDLAKAYEEMGDKDGARELLNEVMREGDAAQQGQAQQLLAKLG